MRTSSPTVPRMRITRRRCVKTSTWYRWKRAIRERSFPLGVLTIALDVKLEDAEASQQTDKVHILNSIAGVQDLEATPPVTSPKFDERNIRLSSKMAVLVFRGQVEAQKSLGRFVASINADQWLQELKLSFHHVALVNRNCESAGQEPSIQFEG